jgi:putative DNA-binding protein
VATPLNIQHDPRRFEPGALAAFTAGSITSLHGHDVSADDAVVSTIAALMARFPVVRRLAGDESFFAMARLFVASEPPCPCALRQYGDTFPRFLRHRGKSASIQYVADIAELEMAWAKACSAADGRPVDARTIAFLGLKKHSGMRVTLHPSVYLVASRFPIVTIWRNNQSDGEVAMIDRWRAEAALVARPFLEVEVRCLPPGGHAFVSALAEGHTVVAAAAAGVAVAPDFDIASNLAILADANVVVGLRDDA